MSVPLEIEFWQQGEFRLHDRLRYRRVRGRHLEAGAARALTPPNPSTSTKILKGVEDRYNRTQTLQVTFAESLTVQGRKRTEKGELYPAQARQDALGIHRARGQAVRFRRQVHLVVLCRSKARREGKLQGDATTCARRSRSCWAS